MLRVYHFSDILKMDVNADYLKSVCGKFSIIKIYNKIWNVAVLAASEIKKS